MTRGRGIRSVEWVAGFFAIFAYSWSLALPFQLDDYSQIPAARVWVTAVLGILHGEIDFASVSDGRADYLFRPVLWLTFLGESTLFGTPLRPALFHATSVLLHAFTTMLLTRLLRGRLGAASALAGGGFYAIHPAALQSVSWVAARGDLLISFFVVIAATLLERRRPARSIVPSILAGLCVGLAILSKIQAMAWVPVFLVISVIAGSKNGGWKSNALGAAAIAAPIAAAYGFHAFWIQSWAPVYAGRSALGGSTLFQALPNLPGLLLHLAVPFHVSDSWPGGPALLTPAVQLVAASGMGIFLVLAVRAGGLRVVLGLALWFLIAGIVVLPSLWILDPSLPSMASRTFASAMLPLSVVIAFATRALGSREGRAWALAARAFVVLLATVSVGTHVHRASHELDAGERVRQRLQAVEDVFKEAGRDAAVCVIDPEPGVRGLPLIHTLIPLAFQPPFRSETLTVEAWPQRNHRELAGVLREHDGPVQVLGIVKGLLAPGEARIPAVLEPLPELVRVDGEGGSNAKVYRPAASIAARAAAGVNLRFGPGGPFVARVSARAGSREVAEEFSCAASASDREFGVGLPESPEWVGEDSLDGILISIVSGDEPTVAVGLARRLPRPVLVQPARADRLVLGNASDRRVPRCVIEALPKAADRVRMRFRFSIFDQEIVMNYVIRLADLESNAEGQFSWEPLPAQAEELTLPNVSWATIPSFLKGRTRRDADIIVHCRVEALLPGGKAVTARSVWSLLRLGGP